MRYDIVLVSYNSERWIPGCMEALRSVDYDLAQLHVLVADNGSQDGTLPLLQAEQEKGGFGGFTVLQNGGNLGFGAACNRGANKGGAPFVFFLNVDTRVDAGVFRALDEAAQQHPEAGGFECRQIPCETGHHVDPVSLETPWASGAVFCVRRTALEQVRGFDEHIFMYCEDVDLSWRLRAFGWRLFYVPRAKVTHYCYENGGPKLSEYAGSFYGNLLLRYKYGSVRDIWNGHKMYLNALMHPVHFDGVRRVFLKNYLRHFLRLWPFWFWRFQNRDAFSAKVARFDGGFSPDRGLHVLDPWPGDEKPLVSVIVRTCARPEVLRGALCSLRNQTWESLEIVVAEDGEPVSREMLEQEFSDLNIVYCNDGKRHGRAANGNRGAAMARGEYLNFLDDDDYFYPDHIELLITELARHPQADMVLGSSMALFGTLEQAKTRLQNMIFDHITLFRMCQMNCIPIQTVLFRKNLFEQYGGLEESLDAHEDWSMWLRYWPHAKRIHEQGPDIRRATSIFVQPATPDGQQARMDKYRQSNRAFFENEELRFDVTLKQMRDFYDEMIADMRCLEARGELHDYLEKQANRDR